MARFGGGVRYEGDQLLRDEDSLSGEHGLELPAELPVPRFPGLHRDGGELPAEHGVVELHREGGELPAGEHGLELPAELMALRFPDLHRDGGGSPSGRGASKR